MHIMKGFAKVADILEIEEHVDGPSRIHLHSKVRLKIAEQVRTLLEKLKNK